MKYKKLFDTIAGVTIPGCSFRVAWCLTAGENYTSELARMTGMEAAQCWKALKVLLKMGIVKVSRREGQKIYYVLNQDYTPGYQPWQRDIVG